MKDDPIKVCPECGSAVKRLLYPVGIVFRGSGWYINDSRPADKSATEETAKASEKSEEGKSAPPTEGGASETKSETKPAETKPSAPPTPTTPAR